MQERRYLLTILLVVLGLVPVFFGSRAYFTGLTQIADRQIKLVTRAREPNEPLEITGLRTDKASIELGRDFKPDSDWLKDFSVTYKNKATKAIVSATIYIAFPESTKTGNVMMYPLSFGTPRKAALLGERSVMIKPEESFTVSLDERNLALLKTFLERRHTLDSLSKIEISAGFLLFDDGTAWSNGSYRIEDPKRPGIWIDDPKQNGVLR